MTNSAEIKAHLLALANKEIEPIFQNAGICNELSFKFNIGACRWLGENWDTDFSEVER